jgi:hypothetical protein
VSQNVHERTASSASAFTHAEGSHRYAIDYYKEDGTHLGPISIEPDFQAACDWTDFMGMRSGRLAPVNGAAAGLVSPLWCEERGAPYCQGFRVDSTAVGPDGDGETVSCEFPRSYFKSLAEIGSKQWLDKGELALGEQYVYHVCAYPIATEFSEARKHGESAGGSSAFQIEAVPDPLPLVESRLETFLQRATSMGPESEGDIPVFIAQSVIDEACVLASEAGELETGGVLVGQLHRDASKPEIFVEVVAQIPGQYAEATGTSFSFTPRTWAAADAAIDLRGRDEHILGWWHSHIRLCNPDCPAERRNLCPLARPFFSADDIHLHGVCFPQPYHVALLISDLPDLGATPAVFGWRSGMISKRGFYAVSEAGSRETSPTQD